MRHIAEVRFIVSEINVVCDIVELSHGAVKLCIQTSSEDMPAAVFAIEVLPKSRDPKNVNYRFSHVCSVSELVEFPAEEDPEMCYFRTDDIEMVFDNINLAIKTRDSVLNDINTLVLLYNQMNDVEIQGTTITISGSTESGTERLDRVFYQRND